MLISSTICHVRIPRRCSRFCCRHQVILVETHLRLFLALQTYNCRSLGCSGNSFLCWLSGFSVVLFRRARRDQTTVGASLYPDLLQVQRAAIPVKCQFRFCRSSKDTGFVLNFGNSNPFDYQGAMMGGADRPITVTAKHPGCYTYSLGACTAGTVYGMCGEDVAQLIISDK